MKKEWSSKWASSKSPRKQRKYRYNAPLHVRHKLVSSNLSEALRNRFGIRSLPLRRGDEAKVVRGESKGFKGNVERIDLKNYKVYIEGLNVKKVDGSEVLKPIDPSNLVITEAKMDDKKRQKVVERAREAKREKPKESGVKEKTEAKEKSTKTKGAEKVKK